MTHLVDPVSAEVLSFVAQAPRSLTEIRGMVAAFVDDAELTVAAVEEDLLTPLQVAGLLEKDPA